MRRPSVRQFILVTGLGLLSLAATAACDSTHKPTGKAAAPVTTTSSDGSPTVDASTAPAQSPAVPVAATDPPRPAAPGQPAAAPPPCLGAVRYTIGSAPPARLCLAVGGVLRIEFAGPADVDITPADKVDCSYEAGIHECRLIATGTVRITIRRSQTTQLTLVIAQQGSPPRPPSACVDTGTFTVNAAEDGPAWPAACVRLGVTLRFTNLGPTGLTVDPTTAATCRYEAGVWSCHFTRTGTVRFTVAHVGSPRPLTVVVVR